MVSDPLDRDPDKLCPRCGLERWICRCRNRVSLIERYGLCGAELIPADEWIDDENGEFDVDVPDAWADYSED